MTQGTISDLSQFRSGSFDAVLCLGGPLSHVLDAEERGRAATGLVRVCRKGAPLFVSVMGRLSVLVVELTMSPHEMEMRQFGRIRDTGDYSGKHGFTACHFFLPEELREAFTDKGVRVLDLVGLEGISSHHAQAVNELARNPRRWKKWIETHYKTCAHPSAAGISEHMMLICRKR